MRLADLIRAKAMAVKQPTDIKRIWEAVSQAQYFEMGEDAATAAGTIATSPVSRMKTAMSLARTPFSKTWIEWVGPSAAYRGNAAAVGHDEIRPNRCGVLIETDETNLRGTMTLAWSGAVDGGAVMPVVSPFVARFDWSDRMEIVPDLLAPATANDVRKAYPESVAGMSDEEILDWNKRHGIAMNNRLLDLWGFLHRMEQGNPAGFDRQIQQCYKDWDGEVRFVQAFLVCLNSKNMLTAEPAPDLSRINKSRKKLGRPPLLSFSTVKLSLSRPLRRGIATDGSSDGVRQHLVRGHFKIRKTGVYWWAPFVRGTPEVGIVVRSGYEVRA